MWYKTCPLCGANLDPGEDCDCEAERRRKKKLRSRFYNNIFEYMKELEELEDERIEV